MAIKPHKNNPDYQRLKRYRSLWRHKKILRLIYRDWYQQINGDLRPGRILEIGSGIGSFKELNPQVISSDIVPCEWLDYCFDAQKIPFAKSSLTNIVMIDVLHHLLNPLKFFDEAYRVLKKGGRVILMEPFPSPFSLLIYKLFHPEPFIFNAELFKRSKISEKQPWDSNQAIPYLLFFKQFEKFQRRYGGKLRIVKREKFSFILYLLSGGFEHPALIPAWLFPLVKKIEHWLEPLKNALAFRCYIVLEKVT